MYRDGYLILLLLLFFFFFFFFAFSFPETRFEPKLYFKAQSSNTILICTTTRAVTITRCNIAQGLF